MARRRVMFWAAVLAAAGVFAAGLTVAYLGYADTSGPDGAVRGYFAALQRRDAPDALAFGAVPDGVHTLLTSTVLAAQQRMAPMHDVTIVSSNEHGSDATVTVRYTLAFPQHPQPEEDAIAVHRSGGTWRLLRTAIATQLQVTAALQRASIVGAGVPDGQVLMFPGAVPVEFDSPYLVLAPSAAVTFATGAVTSVQPAVGPTGRSAVLAALTKAMQRCLSADAARSVACPQPDPHVVPGTLRGQVAGSVPDRVNVTLDDNVVGLLELSGSVRVHATYRRLDFANVARRRAKGTFDLEIHATAYAVAPVRLRWIR